MGEDQLREFIKNLPKAELHLHLEGSLEPELLFKLSQRNNIKIPYSTIEEVKQAYKFTNLQSFLDIYYAACSVLVKEEDFYELTKAYMLKCKEEHVVHTEVFFDPQTHTERGISFDTVIKGIKRALDEAKQSWNISSFIIVSFLRHLSEEAAFEVLEMAKPYKEWIIGVGLDSGENGNPPTKFQRVYEKAINLGFRSVAHAGEEGPAAYRWEALEALHGELFDHGIRILDDPKLVKLAVDHQIPLTVCPLSNVALRACSEIKQHPIKKMFDMGLCVTVNSDDPAYFGGYVEENYVQIANQLGFTKSELVQLARNSIKASFLPIVEKERHFQRLDFVLNSLSK